MIGKTKKIKKIRMKRKKRVRGKISGTADHPRISVFRSTTHIYAQAIDDAAGQTVASASTLSKELKGKLGADIGMPTHQASDAQGDILQALLALGYSDKEAAISLKALPADVGVSDGIKLALKALSRA